MTTLTQDRYDRLRRLAAKAVEARADAQEIRMISDPKVDDSVPAAAARAPVPAAPDILAALRAIDRYLPLIPDPDAGANDDIAEITIELSDWNKIKNAIAKAEGRANG